MLVLFGLLRIVPGAGTAKDVLPLLPRVDATRVYWLAYRRLVRTRAAFESVSAARVEERDCEHVAAHGTDCKG